MTWLALDGLVAYLFVTVGVRCWIQWRLTGSSGFHGLSGPVGSVRWAAGILLVAAMAALAIALVLDLTGHLAPVAVLARSSVRWLGLALFVIGFIATFIAQLTMGASWRIGVDETENTTLVTQGPFAIVRNPIFSAMLVVALGLALMVPNVLALAAWAAAVIAIQLQVRLVEEPHLARIHGDAYGAYVSRVGRFIPRVTASSASSRLR